MVCDASSAERSDVIFGALHHTDERECDRFRHEGESDSKATQKVRFDVERGESEQGSAPFVGCVAQRW